MLTWTKRRVREASEKGHSFDEASSAIRRKIGRNKSYGSTKMVAKLDCHHKKPRHQNLEHGFLSMTFFYQRFLKPLNHNFIKIASAFLIFNQKIIQFLGVFHSSRSSCRRWGFPNDLGIGSSVAKAKPPPGNRRTDLAPHLQWKHILT